MFVESIMRVGRPCRIHFMTKTPVLTRNITHLNKCHILCTLTDFFKKNVLYVLTRGLMFLIDVLMSGTLEINIKDCRQFY